MRIINKQNKKKLKKTIMIVICVCIYFFLPNYIQMSVSNNLCIRHVNRLLQTQY